MTPLQEEFVKQVYYEYMPETLGELTLTEKFKIYDYLLTCEWSEETDQALSILFIDILENIQYYENNEPKYTFVNMVKYYYKKVYNELRQMDSLFK